ncbi:hypothetical protein TH25_24905 [Thalassospira profundimaris]|uniref:IclR family transcriptional regulator n=2 Tax=Thalassospira profundimaris TaxID=502049 RepID=A0A367WFD5_9PROT|nr:hypothetical protein TH25_24905 [Thalassospira profundimaris]
MSGPAVTEKRTDFGVPPITRAVRLLRAIANGERAENMSATARALGINRTTLMRILATLEEERFIEKHPDGHGYRIGLGLVAIAAMGSPTKDLTDLAPPIVRKLAQDLGLSAHLGVLDKSNVIYLMRERPNTPLASNIQPGSHIPAYATTLGRAILATWNPKDVQALFEGVAFESFTDATPNSLPKLLEALDRDRKSGISSSEGYYLPGVWSLGTAVRDQSGTAIAALNVTGTPQHFTEPDERREEIAAVLKQAAKDLSERLGYFAPTS